VGIKLRRIPPRLTAGAYILNSGLSKRGLDDEAYAGMQEMGARAIPQLAQMSPRDFGKLLSAGEIGLGAALLLPIVPSWLAGAGLAGFGAALMKMYHKSPGMTQDGIRPTPEGTGYAKDIWLVGIGLGLLLDHIGSGGKRAMGKGKKGMMLAKKGMMTRKK